MLSRLKHWNGYIDAKFCKFLNCLLLLSLDFQGAKLVYYDTSTVGKHHWGFLENDLGLQHRNNCHVKWAKRRRPGMINYGLVSVNLFFSSSTFRCITPGACSRKSRELFETFGNDNRYHASCSVAWSLFFVWVQKCSLNYIIRFILCTGRRRDRLLLVNSLLKQHRTKSSRTFLRGNLQWQRKRLGSWFVEIHFVCFLLGNQFSSVSEACERVESMGMSLFIQWPW